MVPPLDGDVVLLRQLGTGFPAPGGAGVVGAAGVRLRPEVTVAAARRTTDLDADVTRFELEDAVPTKRRRSNSGAVEVEMSEQGKQDSAERHRIARSESGCQLFVDLLCRVDRSVH